MTSRTTVHTVMSRWLLETDPVRVAFEPTSKTADKIEDILADLSPDVAKRSERIVVRLKDHPYPFEWEFVARDPKGSGNTYIVSVRAYLEPDSKTKLVKTADLVLSCSCPYWRWQGPEFHAKKDQYIYGQPRGTASTPDIRDPERDNFVCKHMARVLKTIRYYVID